MLVIKEAVKVKDLRKRVAPLRLREHGVFKMWRSATRQRLTGGAHSHDYLMLLFVSLMYMYTGMWNVEVLSVRGDANYRAT